MKSNNLLATGLLLLSAASIAVPTIAGGIEKNCDLKHRATKWAEHEGFAAHEFRHLDPELALTEAQKETLKAQREANESTRAALHTKLAEARSALATAVEAGTKDAELNALADRIGKLHAEQALAGAKAKKALLAILTEAQKQALVEARTKRLERKEERESTKG